MGRQCRGIIKNACFLMNILNLIKYWTSDPLNKVAYKCVQLHGGYGFMMEYPIARIYTDARITTIFAGTNEIMKEVIGRSMGM